jgi:hypothetical protein
MKSLMSSLQSYFIIRGCVDHKDQFEIKNVNLIDAKHKLTVYKGPYVDATHLKGKYARRKYCSVQYTEYFLSQKNDPQLIDHFHAYEGKKDDLSDCYLQARYYYEKVLGKKTVQQNNQMAYFKTIAIKDIKKKDQFTERKLRKASILNPNTLKFVLNKYKITKDNFDSCEFKAQIEKTCQKYYGSVDMLWSIWDITCFVQ